MDLAVLVVVLGSALAYVVVRSRRSGRPAVPADPSESLRRRSPVVPRADRFTVDRLGVIRTSKPLLPHSGLLALVVVVVALIVLVNLPLL